jgi:hypothetical protein
MSNSILDSLSKSSLLLISLMGVRTLLERELRLKDMIITTEDAATEELVRRLQDPTTRAVAYPYGYLTMSGMTSIKDQNSTKAIKRHGFRAGMTDVTKLTTKKGFVFPVMFAITLNYLDNDPTRLLKMAEALMILGQIGPLAFDLILEEDMKLGVRVSLPDNATIPIGESENEQSPGAQKLEVELIVNCWAGFFKDVSSVNSDRPIATFQLNNTILG